MSFKGQTTAVTAILVTGLTVGAVASVYVWGSPLLEKRQAQATVSNVEQKVTGLYSEILDVKESGEGTLTPYPMSFSGSETEIRRIEINSDKDYIEITVSVSGASPYAGRWSFVHGNTLQNISLASGAQTGAYAIKGRDSPGVVLVKSERQSASLVTYRIEFRNMYASTPSGPQLEKIDIISQGGEAAGGTTIRIRNEGTKIDSGSEAITLPSGRKVKRVRTLISLDLE